MTLIEFIEKARKEHDLTESVQSIEQRIWNVAKESVKGNKAVLSDEEVLEVILDPFRGKDEKVRIVNDREETEKKYQERLDKELKQQLKKSPPKKEKPKETPHTLKWGDGDMESLF